MNTWFQVYELAHRYVSVLDNDQLEQWPDLFTEDCHYEIIPKENFDAGLKAPVIYCTNRKMLRDRVISLRHANIYERHTYRHMISGLVVKGETDGEVETTCSYVVILTNQSGESSVYQAGVFHDIVSRRDGVMRYRRKIAVYDTLRVQTLLATPI